MSKADFHPIPPTVIHDQAETFKLQGNQYLQRGMLDEAARAYLRALAVQPDHFIVLSNHGIVLQAQGKLNEAVERFSQALAIQPDFVAALSNLGAVLLRLGRWQEAESRLRQALTLEPDNPEAHSNLGNVFLTQGRTQEAIRHYQRAVELNPELPDPLANLGIAYQDMGQLAKATDFLERAMRLNPHHHETWTNLGTVYHRQGRLDDAMTSLSRALQLKPDHPEALANQGALLVELGRFPEALARFREALKHAPDLADAHMAEGLTLLLLGDFKGGWAKHEWRWQRIGFPGHGLRVPLWDGQRLDGRSILLHCEKGMGDSIQFVRFARDVKAMGGHVVLRCPSCLLPLLATAQGIDQWFTDGSPIPECDCHAPLMSLPYLLGTTFDTLTAPSPYLTAPITHPLPTHWIQRPGPRVGLVWRGNFLFRDDFKRSMDPNLLAPLLAIPGITFIGLQVAPRPGDMETFVNRPNFYDASPHLTDFAQTAAVIAALDLVIAVDTAVLHLAGALARPTWALLPHIPDWRWLLDRDDSPWYPTMRLFRQYQRDDWADVITRVAEQLRSLLGELGTRQNQ
ncbi:MAG: glycosyltransferase family protein [Nitrospirae bacterium]|nr:glycosyltransferase family protein [Magnetococcales bacterium]